MRSRTFASIVVVVLVGVMGSVTYAGRYDGLMDAFRNLNRNLDTPAPQRIDPPFQVREYETSPKIEIQMSKRGWDHDLIQDTLSNPYRTQATRDTRYLSNGGRLDDPATAYIRRDEHYVVRNDLNRDIVQISDRNNPNWKSPYERQQ